MERNQETDYPRVLSNIPLSPWGDLGQTAEDILNERYANGELTRELYMQMKEDMKKTT